MGVFVVASLYAILSGSPHTLLAGIAFVLIIVGALPKNKSQMTLAFLIGGSVIMLLQTSKISAEGFVSSVKSGAGLDVDPTRVPSPVPVDETGSPDHAGSPPGTGDYTVKEDEGFDNKRALLPNNTDAKEPLELGKAYTLPSESDDKGFHLDSGTTFMNAYKALKPEQIAAMTKDTQELLATQKSLMSMLDSMKPLLSDGQNMMNMFGSYFGKDQ